MALPLRKPTQNPTVGLSAAMPLPRNASNPSLESVESDKSNRLMAAAAAGAATYPALSHIADRFTPKSDGLAKMSVPGSVIPQGAPPEVLTLGVDKPTVDVNGRPIIEPEILGPKSNQFGFQHVPNNKQLSTTTATGVPLNQQVGAALDIDPYTGQVAKGPIDLLGKFRPAVSKIGAAASEIGKGLVAGEALQTAKRGLYNAGSKSTFGNVVTAAGLGMLGDNDAAKKALFGQSIDNLSPLARGAKDLLNSGSTTPTVPEVAKSPTTNPAEAVDPYPSTVASKAPVAELPVPSARTQNGNDDTMTFPGGSLTMHNGTGDNRVANIHNGVASLHEGTGNTKLMGVDAYNKSTPESLAQLDKTMAYNKTDAAKENFKREAATVDARYAWARDKREAEQAANQPQPLPQPQNNSQNYTDQIQGLMDELPSSSSSDGFDKMIANKHKRADIAAKLGIFQGLRKDQLAQDHMDQTAQREQNHYASEDKRYALSDQRANQAQANADRTNERLVSNSEYQIKQDGLHQADTARKEAVTAGIQRTTSRREGEDHSDKAIEAMIKERYPNESAQKLAKFKTWHTGARDLIAAAGYNPNYHELETPDIMGAYQAFEKADAAGNSSDNPYLPNILENPLTSGSAGQQAFNQYFVDRKLPASK